MNQRFYIDVGGFVWEVISPFDISSSAKNSRRENTETKGMIKPSFSDERRESLTNEVNYTSQRLPSTRLGKKTHSVVWSHRVGEEASISV
jgi:hypothetical protein